MRYSEIAQTVSRVDVPRALAALVDADIDGPAQGVPPPRSAGATNQAQRFTKDVWRALLITFCVPYAGFLWALITVPSPGGAFGAQIGVSVTLTLHGLIELALFFLYPTSGYGLHLLLACGAFALATFVWVRVVLTLLMPDLVAYGRREGMVQLDGEDVLAHSRKGEKQRGTDDDTAKLAALV
ncbi:hypothetical protein EXIGLDRAFT_838115 [Exidia glandulosa HHB12029]|uniref:Uncharacterized protein n=1 Tax=Exidia glandulosa HHB12029 TaxID=1314781 RepID=A0A165G5G3_EXIGL|nr:hypothetical protein EXIGLDRAFT_838115 [Exidia glandulosa HHB12029]